MGQGKGNYRQHLTVKLDEWGYPGEELDLWVNFPPEVRKKLFEHQDEEVIQQFLRDQGILVRTSFVTEDGVELPLEQVPWDVQLLAANKLVEEILRRNKAINARREEAENKA